VAAIGRIKWDPGRLAPQARWRWPGTRCG